MALQKTNRGSFFFRCAQNTDSKATILRKAVDYILLLEDELRKYTDAYQEAAIDDDEEDNEAQSP